MIEAIETIYRGYKFRSRLEARWAIFFDHMDIRFQYEPEGFKLASGWYLPDFWLPQVRMWAEVKRGVFSEREARLTFELSESTGFPCLLLEGEPDFRAYKSMSVMKGKDETGKIISGDIDISYYLISESLKQGRFYYCQQQEEAISDYGSDYQEAVYKARGYRFESDKD